VHVREGQRIVAKVLRVDPRKDQIDLSIKRVPEQMKKLKILEAKRNQTATALFQIIYEKIPDDKKEHAEEVRNILIRNFELIYYGLEFAANNEVEELLDLGIEETWAKTMKEVASDNIQPAMVEIKGIMEISIPGGNGVQKLRKALINGRDKTKEKNTNIEIYTLGSPRYAIEVEAQDYKIAEKVLDNTLERIEEEVSNQDGTFSFERE
jgi:translation initiation factor 2 subunit 1